MTISTTPHINLRGTAREALGFYHAVFGGEIALVSYADAYAVSDPAEKDQIMWGQVSAPGFRVMAYDVPGHRPWSAGDAPYFVSVRGDDTAEITAIWEKMAADATIIVPLAPAGWSPLYGMLRDRFGVTFVLDVAPAQPD